jgi:competence protein ComEA
VNENPVTATEADVASFAAAVGRLRAARALDDAARVPGRALDDASPAPGRAFEDVVSAPGRAFEDAVPSARAVVETRPPSDAVVSTRAVPRPRREPSSEAADLRDRAAGRREATAAAKQAAAAYATLHGHVPGGDDEELDGASRARWALRPRTAVVATCAVLVLAAGAAAATMWPRGHVEELAPARVVASAQAQEPGPGPAPAAAPTPTASPLVVVDVVGQVHNPGLVTLPAGARVFDAVSAAGGATAGAELGAINLARPVVDGEQVRVPAPGEAVAAAPAAPGVAAAPGGAPGTGGPVNLNTADEATLDTLPGIGPALAARIVAWRTDNGPFASVDELDEVSGIGPAMLAKVRDLVTV